jgi:hypothetical protein
MQRKADITGFSGTGHVADVVEFDDGVVVMHWRGEYASTTVWDSLAKAIVVHGHDGATEFVPLVQIGN